MWSRGLLRSCGTRTNQFIDDRSVPVLSASAEPNEDRGRPPRAAGANHELNLPDESLPRGPSLANVRPPRPADDPEKGVSA
ncbi:hypothetical protein GCM10009624_21110 [Gordonia sinesedis]